MQYRHEWKHEINALDRRILLSRLSAVMQWDAHAIDGTYRIRSLYFDTPGDTALREKNVFAGARPFGAEALKQFAAVVEKCGVPFKIS